MKPLGIKLSWIWALAFLLSGVLGFTPNPVVGSEGFFITDTLHNVVHLTSGLAFIAVALMWKTPAKFMLGFGIVYMTVGVVGFFTTMDSPQGMLLGLIHINAMDNFLHLALGVAILASGYLAKNVDAMPRRSGSRVWPQPL